MQQKAPQPKVFNYKGHTVRQVENKSWRIDYSALALTTADAAKKAIDVYLEREAAKFFVITNNDIA